MSVVSGAVVDLADNELYQGAVVDLADNECQCLREL